MKKIIILFLYGISSTIFAQQGINYKAIVKDNLGNVVANQTIDIQFIIYQGSGETNNVYQETHMPTTDTNGIIIVNIGEGTTSDVFTDINWGSDEHYLNVQIDIGDGLVDMGTTQFMAVPYALHASNLSGLEAIDEGNGFGWRLIGLPPENYAAIGFNAIQLGINDLGPTTSPFFGSLGDYSFTVGQLSRAAGTSSIAIGYSASAETDFSVAISGRAAGAGSIAVGGGAIGNNSFAFGGSAIGNNSVSIDGSAIGDNSISIGGFAEGNNTISIGDAAVANGDFSVALGNNTIVNSYRSTAIGRFNVGEGSRNTWVSNEPLFEIGNGSDFRNRSNAFTVLKNGYVGIGTATPNFPLHITTRNPNAADWDGNPNHFLSNGGVGINGTGWTYSIVADYGLWSGLGFAVSSDARIKNNLGRSNSKKDLETLLNIEITDYNYIDQTKGNKITKKVIAQQVKEVLPSAVNYVSDFIPNIYTMASVEFIDKTILKLFLPKETDLVSNDILKLLSKNGQTIEANVLSINKNKDEVIIKLNNKYTLGEQIFVYGKKVDDFHTVDYDAISMLNVSATQAQQKLIEKLQDEIQSLKKQNYMLQTEVSKMSELEKDILELKAMFLTKKEETKITQN